MGIRRRAARLAFCALFALFALALAQPALAATHIASTTYTTSTTWTAAGSPYVLDGAVTVAAGATLTIDPGVVVKLNGQLRSLLVNGTLSAIGTPSNHVVFTSLQDDTVGGDSGGDGPTVGAPGQWYAVQFRNGSSFSHLSYVDVRYGGYGSGNSGYGELTLNDAGTALAIDHATITQSQTSGVLAALGPTANISSSTISNNGNGVSVNAAAATITQSTIANNSGDGVWSRRPTGRLRAATTTSASPASSSVAVPTTSTSAPARSRRPTSTIPRRASRWGKASATAASTTTPTSRR
jgi:hypothetical protein